VPHPPFAPSSSKGFPASCARKGRASTGSARTVFGALLALSASVAAAQPAVTSAAPDHVEITLYRAANPDLSAPMDLEWLEGYALISETRRIAIPAGESDVRFEGVAGGIVPQSAIVAGFPDGIVERNRDAYLLSPDTLLDRSLGRRVHLRRTNRATGAVTEQDAVIRSGADGAVVLQTRDGIEALRCTGQQETLLYNEVPAGLSSRPTLSVRVRAAHPLTATVTLSYLSNGFDWRANYIAQLAPDGSRMNLTAWLTLASMDETSFVCADAQAVAGRLNRTRPDREESDDDGDDYDRALNLHCWPWDTTGYPVWNLVPVEAQNARLRGMMRDQDLTNDLPGSDDSELIVTGARMTRQEELGDLKLYRIQQPVTVAAHSQKQVAFLERTGIRTRLVYRHRIALRGEGEESSTDRVLMLDNRRADGLGVPLPAGSIQLFSAARNGRPILLAEGTIADRAVGEAVEILLGDGDGDGVSLRNEVPRSGMDWEEHVLTMGNDHAVPVNAEVEFDVDDEVESFTPGTPLPRRNGRPAWAVTIPANGHATMRYRVSWHHD
jgi:hypothetical protein